MARMNITLLDRSNYFRGLLLLLRKDQKIATSEIDMMKRVGKSLGFDAEFCDNAIREVLSNIHIKDMPPMFSSKGIAMKFIKDGFFVALADNEVHPSEEQWLRAVAERNEVDEDTLLRLHQKVMREREENVTLEADNLAVVMQ
jgi:hypothetical protein